MVLTFSYFLIVKHPPETFYDGDGYCLVLCVWEGKVSVWFVFQVLCSVFMVVVLYPKLTYSLLGIFMIFRPLVDALLSNSIYI